MVFFKHRGPLASSTTLGDVLEHWLAKDVVTDLAFKPRFTVGADRQYPFQQAVLAHWASIGRRRVHASGDFNVYATRPPETGSHATLYESRYLPAKSVQARLIIPTNPLALPTWRWPELLAAGRFQKTFCRTRIRDATLGWFVLRSLNALFRPSVLRCSRSDGRPLSTGVDLIPADASAGLLGHVAGMSAAWILIRFLTSRRKRAN